MSCFKAIREAACSRKWAAKGATLSKSPSLREFECPRPNGAAFDGVRAIDAAAARWRGSSCRAARLR